MHTSDAAIPAEICTIVKREAHRFASKLQQLFDELGLVQDREIQLLRIDRPKVCEVTSRVERCQQQVLVTLCGRLALTLRAKCWVNSLLPTTHQCRDSDLLADILTNVIVRIRVSHKML